VPIIVKFFMQEQAYGLISPTKICKKMAKYTSLGGKFVSKIPNVDGFGSFFETM